MKYRRLCVAKLCLFLACLAPPLAALAAEPKVQILSPVDGSRIVQDKNSIFVSGKVAREAGRSSNVDIFLVIDVSGSTAMYAGATLAEADQPPEISGFVAPQIRIGDPSVSRPPPLHNPRNSILAAQVAAARRLLAQLNAETTRVGVLTFSNSGKILQPLTNDFDQIRRALRDISYAGPHGGTNMVEGIRMATAELFGLGISPGRTDAIKVQILLTDGFPTLPIGGGKKVTVEDMALVINAARLAGKAGIKVHVFALGEESLAYPTTALGIARESGGTYTPVMRPADVLAVLDSISVVGVEYVQVVNQTMGRRVNLLRLAPDGFFSAALPVVEGRNQIEVSARASDGSNGRAMITVMYQSGTQKSLDLEVFLDKERKLQLEVDRLGRSSAEIQREVERNRQEGLERPAQLPPPTDGPVR